MVSDRGTQVIAVCFILLLAGADCARISSHASSHAAQKENDDGIFGGHEVCRRRELKSRDRNAAAERYNEKLESLQKLSTEVSAPDCAQGCMKQWYELKNRMKQFGSCSSLLNETEAFNVRAPPSLIETMKSKDKALAKVFLEPMNAATAAIKNSQAFPVVGNCSFNPMDLSLVKEVASGADTATAKELVRAKLFGENCDEATSREYIENLEGQAKSTAMMVTGIVEKVFELAQTTKAKAEEVDVTDDSEEQHFDSVVQETAKGAQAIATQFQLDDVSDSLLEFDEEGEEDGEADDDDDDMQIAQKKKKPGVVRRFFNKFFKFIWVLIKLLFALFIIAVIVCLVIGVSGGTPFGFGAVAVGYQAAFAPILAPVLAPLGVHASAAGVWISQTAWPTIIGVFAR